jgi:hypothetical protein
MFVLKNPKDLRSMTLYPQVKTMNVHAIQLVIQDRRERN